MESRLSKTRSHLHFICFVMLLVLSLSPPHNPSFAIFAFHLLGHAICPFIVTITQFMACHCRLMLLSCRPSANPYTHTCNRISAACMLISRAAAAWALAFTVAPVTHPYIFVCQSRGLRPLGRWQAHLHICANIFILPMLGAAAAWALAMLYADICFFLFL